ncbi:MAG: hypothetical protein K8S62_07080 [Candidatus Sabulitectum sp.]|nr:hypothetical protein [Candidatus Sabulitectum sp.]
MTIRIRKTADYSVNDSDLVITVKFGQGKMGTSTILFNPSDPEAISIPLAVGQIKKISIGDGGQYRGGKLIIITKIADLKTSNNRISVGYEIKGGNWITVCPSFSAKNVAGSTVETILEVNII